MVGGVKTASAGGGFWILSDFRELLDELLWFYGSYLLCNFYLTDKQDWNS